MAMSTTNPEASIFSQNHSRLPDNTVFFAIFPDSFVSSSATDVSSSLQSLHLHILDAISSHTSSDIWQHVPFSISLSTSASCVCSSSHTPSPPHLHDKLCFGDNFEDKWFTVFLLFKISSALNMYQSVLGITMLESRVYTTWESSYYPSKRVPSPNLVDAFKFLINCEEESCSADEVQQVVKNRIAEYPERVRRNLHQVRVRVPALVAQVPQHEPYLISLVVEAFYNRDIDTMNYAAKMERF